MAPTEQTILGVFDKPEMADQAIDALQSAGFSNTQIHEVGQHHSGGFMAGLKSFFMGDDTTTDASNFSGMGISDEETQYYENASQAGHRVIAVQTKGREQEVMDLLQTNGASINTTQRANNAASTLQTTETENNAQTAYDTVNETADSKEEHVLRLREEQLNIGKQRVQTGEVGLHKEIITEQKAVDVPVMHEEVFIKRRPGTNAISTDTTPIGEGEAIRVPTSEEHITVSKDTIVTGEVTIGKRAVEETKQVSDTVRREEARIEQEGDAPIHGTPSDRFHPDSVNKNTH